MASVRPFWKRGVGPAPIPIPPATGIVWYGSPNFSDRLGYSPTAIVLHTMDGALSGTDSWFGMVVSQVSAHYGVGLQGQIHQYVGEDQAAWANGVLEAGNRWPYHDGINPNYRSISIETEDLGNPGNVPVSAAQYSAVLGLCSAIIQRHPSVTMLVAHDVISPQSRAGCPGPRWTDTKMTQLGKALRLTVIF